MVIKRYFAPNIRQAINQVRMEQGPDAVILSNRKVDGGVEIVAAVDYDETIFQQRFQEKTATSGEAVGSSSPQDTAISEKCRHRVLGRETSADSAGIVWSSDPTLRAMRSELQMLRGMLENQLSGLAWGELTRRRPVEAELIQRLMKLGLGAGSSRDIASATAAGGDADVERCWQQALRELSRRLPVADTLLEQGGVVALVGPTGVGKTTTVAKLAARYALRYGRRHVAMVTIDNYRVGAYEQLRTYGRILDIPVRIAEDHGELQAILDDFCDRSLVLIDTVGMSQHDHKLLQQCTILDDERHRMRKILLLAATSRLSGVDDVIEAFRIFEPAGCIVTKIDESTSLGAVLDGVRRHGLPLTHVCDGQRVPEDIHTARPQDLVARAVEIMARAGDKIEEELVPLHFHKEVVDACL